MGHKTGTAYSIALALGLALGGASTAAAEDPTVFEQEWTDDPEMFADDVSESDLESFLAAAHAAQDIRAEYADDIAEAEGEDAQELRDEANDEMVAAIEDEDLTVEEYQDIAYLIDNDSDLADGMFLDVDEHEARAVAHHPRLELAYVSEAPVPLADAPVTRFMLFREGNGILEHVAVVIGEPSEWPEAVPVRLHSACLTGDLFGSLRCDCGDQLRLGVKAINESGGGVLLYLAQEGRGIGLANKLRAYTMQTAGLDTIDSDCQLGFEADGRRYDAAVEMLEFLGIDTVRVLTNNPAKIEALRAGGIQVAAREPVHGTLNPHNLRYLSTKADRGGHWLQELLASEAERG